MKILNLEPLDYAPEARAILGTIGQVDDGPLDRAGLLDVIGRYDIAIVRLAHQFDEEVLAAAPNLKALVTATTGLNHIDMAAAEKRDIAVLSLRGETAFLNTITSTAELAWALLLQLMRPVAQARADVLGGHWRRDLFKGSEISGKRIGILGCGRLGRQTAAHAKAFSADVVVHDVRPIEGYEQVGLDELLRSADIVFIHLPYNETTHHFLDQHRLSAMKPGARLINTARGEIVDEQALLHLLETGHLAGAAMDVMQGENLANPDWMACDKLVAYARAHDNLIITPHIGGASLEAMAKTEIFMAQKLQGFIGKACK